MVDLQVCLKRQLIACDRKGFFFPVQLAGARTIAKAGLLQIEGKLGRLVQIPIQAHAPGFGGGRVGFGAIDKVDEGIFVDIVFLIARNDFPRTEAAVGVERVVRFDAFEARIFTGEESRASDLPRIIV